MTKSSKLLFATLLTVVSLLGVRMAMTLSDTTLGWKAYLGQWVDASWFTIGLQRPAPLGESEPAAQAAYWLQQTSRVPQVRTESRTALGAAWMLDGPDYGFIARYTSKMQLEFLPERNFYEIQDRVFELIEDYEERCGRRCVQTIDAAVRMDPEDVGLWRSRALLSFRSEIGSVDLTPRRDDWLQVLDECAAHDPGNALYDYLAAHRLWSLSAKLDVDDGWTIKISDRVTFDSANERYRAGLDRPFLRVGTLAYSGTFDFLEYSSLPRTEHLGAAGNRFVVSRSNTLLHRLLRWQTTLFDDYRRDGHFDKAEAAARSLLRVSDQVAKQGNNPQLSFVSLTLRRAGLDKLLELEEDRPEMFSAEESRSLTAQRAAATLERSILGEVGDRLRKQIGDQSSVSLLSTFVTAAAALGFGLVALSLAVILGLGGWFVRFGTEPSASGIGLVRHVIAWVVGLSVSFVVLGLFPTEVVPVAVQGWLRFVGTWSVFALLLAAPLYGIRRRLGPSWRAIASLSVSALAVAVVLSYPNDVVSHGMRAFRMHDLIVVVAALCMILVTTWVIVRLLWELAFDQSVSTGKKAAAAVMILLVCLAAVNVATRVADLAGNGEPKPLISAKVWDVEKVRGFTASDLRNALRLNDGGPVWAFVQWQSHRGPATAALLAVALLILFAWKRSTGDPLSPRSRLAACAGTGARSCLFASLCALACFLYLAGALVEFTDAYNQVNRQRLVDADFARQEIESIRVQIRSDEAVMRRLRQEAGC